MTTSSLIAQNATTSHPDRQNSHFQIRTVPARRNALRPQLPSGSIVTDRLPLAPASGRVSERSRGNAARNVMQILKGLKQLGNALARGLCGLLFGYLIGVNLFGGLMDYYSGAIGADRPRMLRTFSVVTAFLLAYGWCPLCQ